MYARISRREDFTSSLTELIRQEKHWIPKEKGASLYIRPLMIGIEPSVKVKPSSEYLFFILLSPVGPYFKSGFKAVKILVQDHHHRACEGGTGGIKAGGNYGGSLYPTMQANQNFGCEQVLWLDAQKGKYIEEVGAMNIWFVEGGKKLRTPKLSGSILPGVVRDSLLQLGPHLGYEAVEESIEIDEVISKIKSGEITEVFGSGTAAVVSSVGGLVYKGEDIKVGNGESGPVATKLFEEITNIQYGLSEDPFGWRLEV